MEGVGRCGGGSVDPLVLWSSARHRDVLLLRGLATPAAAIVIVATGAVKALLNGACMLGATVVVAEE